MTSSSPFQRFMAELRRRHVPQTVAVYVVAAWAAIQFADVVVELDGRLVARSDAAPPVLTFEAIWVAGNRLGAMPVRITIRGAEGSQAERRFAVGVVPATTDR